MKKLLTILLILIIPVAVYSAEEWDKDIPLSTDLKIDFPTDNQANLEALDRLLSNYREGMKLTYSSGSTVVVSAGEIVCSNAAGTIRKFRKNTSSTNVTFADIDTGAEANNTYYLYAVCDADAATATFKLSLSSTSPDSITYYKRLGSIVNSDGDMEQIANDNEHSIVATGTIADGETISLPSGYSQDECNWIVSVGNVSGTTAQARGLQILDFTATGDRVVSADITTWNWVDGGVSTSWTGTANYLITCYR